MGVKLDTKDSKLKNMWIVQPCVLHASNYENCLTNDLALTQYTLMSGVSQGAR